MINKYIDQLTETSIIFYRNNPDTSPGLLLDAQIKFLEKMRTELDTDKKELTTTRKDRKEYRKLYRTIKIAITYYNKILDK